MPLPTPTLARFALLAFTDGDRWEPGIGDPTVVGWVTVVAYFAAAWLCGWCARCQAQAGSNAGSGARLFWSLLTVALVLLGINKQLDLQTWLTLFGRHLAIREGWYSERRPLQAAFIGVVALGGAVSLFGLRRLVRTLRQPIGVALLGGIVLGCFILIRASSFHHVDQMLGMKFEGIKMNGLLELGGIGIIAGGALLELKAGPLLRRRPDQSSRRSRSSGG